MVSPQQNHGLARYCLWSRESEPSYSHGVQCSNAFTQPKTGVPAARDLLLLGPRRIVPQKSAVACFLQIASRQFQNCLCRIFLTRGEAVAVEFEKQNSHYKACALVAINKLTILNDTGRISGRHVDEIRRLG